jgi:uncharacterized protein (UPF0332 family)
VTDEGAAAAVAGELVLAEECVAAARHEAAGGFHRRAVSSAYYAVFHAARAALARSGLEARSHSGVRHLFALHLIRPGVFPPSDARLLRYLQKDREEADYVHVAPFGPAAAAEAIDRAADFLTRVQRHVAAAT